MNTAGQPGVGGALIRVDFDLLNEVPPESESNFEHKLAGVEGVVGRWSHGGTIGGKRGRRGPGCERDEGWGGSSAIGAISEVLGEGC